MTKPSLCQSIELGATAWLFALVGERQEPGGSAGFPLLSA